MLTELGDPSSLQGHSEVFASSADQLRIAQAELTENPPPWEGGDADAYAEALRWHRDVMDQTATLLETTGEQVDDHANKAFIIVKEIIGIILEILEILLAGLVLTSIFSWLADLIWIRILPLMHRAIELLVRFREMLARFTVFMRDVGSRAGRMGQRAGAFIGESVESLAVDYLPAEVRAFPGFYLASAVPNLLSGRPVDWKANAWQLGIFFGFDTALGMSADLLERTVAGKALKELVEGTKVPNKRTSSDTGQPGETSPFDAAVSPLVSNIPREGAAASSGSETLASGSALHQVAPTTRDLSAGMREPLATGSSTGTSAGAAKIVPAEETHLLKVGVLDKGGQAETSFAGGKESSHSVMPEVPLAAGRPLPAEAPANLPADLAEAGALPTLARSPEAAPAVLGLPETRVGDFLPSQYLFPSSDRLALRSDLHSPSGSMHSPAARSERSVVETNTLPDTNGGGRVHATSEVGTVKATPVRNRNTTPGTPHVAAPGRDTTRPPGGTSSDGVDAISRRVSTDTGKSQAVTDVETGVMPGSGGAGAESGSALRTGSHGAEDPGSAHLPDPPSIQSRSGSLPSGEVPEVPVLKPLESGTGAGSEGTDSRSTQFTHDTMTHAATGVRSAAQTAPTSERLAHKVETILNPGGVPANEPATALAWTGKDPNVAESRVPSQSDAPIEAFDKTASPVDSPSRALTENEVTAGSDRMQGPRPEEQPKSTALPDVSPAAAWNKFEGKTAREALYAGLREGLNITLGNLMTNGAVTNIMHTKMTPGQWAFELLGGVIGGTRHGLYKGLPIGEKWAYRNQKEGDLVLNRWLAEIPIQWSYYSAYMVLKDAVKRGVFGSTTPTELS
ncbi:hypothetical protein ACIA8E_40745 [Streptomyces sp. NPDC051664]|uniref:hypothetical protein n=1 Tax=Streptomyces sp. NPDC051664 TaxID=3365668 RepID=UPI0037A8200B